MLFTPDSVTDLGFGMWIVWIVVDAKGNKTGRIIQEG